MAQNALNSVEINPNLPNFLLSIIIKYLKLGYRYLISNAFYLLTVPIVVAMVLHLSILTLEDFMNHFAMLKSCSTLFFFGHGILNESSNKRWSIFHVTSHMNV